MAMRRPRIYRAAPTRRSYLFSEQATVYELTLHLQEKLKKELADLSAEALLNHSAQEVAVEIVERYTLSTPKLDRNNIAEIPPKEMPTHRKLPAKTIISPSKNGRRIRSSCDVQ